MTYSFPSQFTTFDPSKAFSGGYGNFSNSGILKSGSGGNMLGLAGTLGSSLIGAFSGFGQAQTAASIAQAQADQARDRQIYEREVNKGALAQGIHQMVYGSTTAPQLAFGFQERAKKLELGPFAERQLGLGSEASKRDRLARISPESQKAALFEAELNRRNQIGLDQSKLAGLFGETGFSRRFTG
jgi:hypothetical protein